MLIVKNITWRTDLSISILHHCIVCFRNSYVKFFYKEKASEYIPYQEFPAIRKKNF